MMADALLRPSSRPGPGRYNPCGSERPATMSTKMPESREQSEPYGGSDPGDSDPIRDLLPQEPVHDEVLGSASAQAEDHALIRRAQAGDEAAFAQLVREHQGRAWRVAKNLVGSEEDARDLVQEAFLRVFRNLEGFDFEHGFTTWLYRIVTNLAIDHLRKRRTALSTTRTDEDEGDLDLPDRGGDRPSERLEHHELSEDVRACLESLAPHFQNVLVLREMEGLPCKEIARIVGATHVTVRWRLHRGRKLFQEEWERRRRLAEKGGDRGFPSSPASNPSPASNRHGGSDVPPAVADPEGPTE